jgi:hypothetical protein
MSESAPQTGRAQQAIGGGRVQIVELIGPVVRQAGCKDFVISCQHPSPVAVKVPLAGDAGMMTSALAHPGIFLQCPGLLGVDKHTVTSVGCAAGSQVFGLRVALTALAPPGSTTSSGGVNMYWQPAASDDSSTGTADAIAVAPPKALAKVAAAAADANIERSTIIGIV